LFGLDWLLDGGFDEVLWGRGTIMCPIFPVRARAHHNVTLCHVCASTHTWARELGRNTGVADVYLVPYEIVFELGAFLFLSRTLPGARKGGGGVQNTLIITLYVQGHKKCARGSKNIIFLPGKVQCIQAEWPCLLISFSERMGHTVLPSFTSISRPK